MTATPTPSQPPLSAGAVPELPVVAWASTVGLREVAQGYLMMVHMLEGAKYSHAMTLHAPAQATINAQAAEIERLTRERDEARLLLSNEVFLKNLDAELGPEPDELKAKQAADIDEVMRLADEYARSMWAHTSTSKHADAAREALRAAVTKDRT